MSAAVLILRLGLAAVFVMAGVTKLADRDGFRQAVREFSAPEWAVAPLAILVPIWEFAAAVLLLINPTVVAGAAVALALLAVFCAAIVFNLTQGRTPDCHCFGQVHSEPIGANTLIRNAVLGAMAVFVLAVGLTNPGVDLFGWMGGLTDAERAGLGLGVLGVALLAAQTWYLLKLNSNQQQLAERLLTLSRAPAPGPEAEAAEAEETQAGLPVGSPAPDFRLPDLHGRKVGLKDLLEAGKTTMLLFISPTCGPCNALAPDLARWQEEYDPALQFIMVSTGGTEENRAKASENGFRSVLLQKKFEIGEKFLVAGTPSAVLIEPGGTIASPLAQGADEIRALLDQYIELLAAQAGITLIDEGEADRAMREAASPLTIGAPAPDVTFKGLMGETVPLSDFRGRDTVLLFWEADCTHCQDMQADLEAWERERPPDAPELIVSIPGGVIWDDPIKFRSPIVMRVDPRPVEEFHAFFTPSAVLINAEGRIASQPAIGAEAIFRLLGWRHGRSERIPA